VWLIDRVLSAKSRGPGQLIIIFLVMGSFTILEGQVILALFFNRYLGVLIVKKNVIDKINHQCI